jgi:excisionase family DNA binding protein
MQKITNDVVSKLFKNQSNLLTREEAAEYLGVTSRTLAVWACVKRYNLPYVKVGRLVKYRRSDLDNFIARRTVSQQEMGE